MPATVTYTSCCDSSGNALDDFYMLLIQKIHNNIIKTRKRYVQTRVSEGNLDNELLFCSISQEPVKQITQNIFCYYVRSVWCNNNTLHIYFT